MGHLGKNEFETVWPGLDCVRRSVEDAVLRNLRFEDLMEPIERLNAREQKMISLQYDDKVTTLTKCPLWTSYWSMWEASCGRSAI